MRLCRLREVGTPRELWRICAVGSPTGVGLRFAPRIGLVPLRTRPTESSVDCCVLEDAIMTRVLHPLMGLGRL